MMTPRQKRAYNRARAALSDLLKETIHDEEAFNRGLMLLVSTTGTALGAMTAAQGQDVAQLDGAVTRAAREMQRVAAISYAEYLAEQKHAAGTRH